MSLVQKFAPGEFSWHDLSTNDVVAAKKFYGELLGWSFQDIPMGDASTYTMCIVDGQRVGAVSEQRPEMKQQNVPPHWNSYITVANADAAVAKAKELGGQVLMPAFDVMDQGRMAVLQDPSGAAFSIWEAHKNPGAGRIDELGAVCWNELMTKDMAKAKSFYTQLFGWTTKESPMGMMEYTQYDLGGKAIGGSMTIAAEWGPHVPSHWNAYWVVADCDAAAAKAVKMGASLLMPPMDIEKIGRFCMIRDPQGATFAIIKMASM